MKETSLAALAGLSLAIAMPLPDRADATTPSTVISPWDYSFGFLIINAFRNSHESTSLLSYS